MNNISNQNGTFFNYALTRAPIAQDFVGVATVDPNSIQSISANSQQFQAMDVNSWKDNKMQEWTVTVERELMRNTILKLSYVGSHGSNLQQHWDVNAPIARYNYQAATGNLAPTNADLRRINPNWNMTGSFGALQHNGFSIATLRKSILNGDSRMGWHFKHFMCSRAR